MANLSTFSITLGATDYPVKYAGLLAYVEPYLTNVENFSFPGGGAVSIAGAFSAASISTTGDSQAASFNGGQLAGMRNKIINGKMEIAQRGTSFAAVGNGTYTLDRFAWNKVGDGIVTISRQSDVPTGNEFQNSLRVAVTTADTSIVSTDAYAVYQAIEGYNARDLIGRTFTLSFWVRSTKTGTHCVAFSNSNVDRSYVATYTVNASNTWEKKSVTVSGGLITAGTWNWTDGVGLYLRFTLAVGSTRQTTAGAWQTGEFWGTSAQVNCMDSTSNIFAITGVQLEVGSVATPFEHRPYQTELALAQRYFEKYDVHWTWDGSLGGAATVSVHVPFKVTKRGAPTITVSSASNNNITQGAYSVTTEGFESALTFDNGGTIQSRSLRSIYFAAIEL